MQILDVIKQNVRPTAQFKIHHVSTLENICFPIQILSWLAPPVRVNTSSLERSMFGACETGYSQCNVNNNVHLMIYFRTYLIRKFFEGKINILSADNRRRFRIVLKRILISTVHKHNSIRCRYHILNLNYTIIIHCLRLDIISYLIVFIIRLVYFGVKLKYFSSLLEVSIRMNKEQMNIYFIYFKSYYYKEKQNVIVQYPGTCLGLFKIRFIRYLYVFKLLFIHLKEKFSKNFPSLNFFGPFALSIAPLPTVLANIIQIKVHLVSYLDILK